MKSGALNERVISAEEAAVTPQEGEAAPVKKEKKKKEKKEKKAAKAEAEDETLTAGGQSTTPPPNARAETAYRGLPHFGASELHVKRKLCRTPPKKKVWTIIGEGRLLVRFQSRWCWSAHLVVCAAATLLSVPACIRPVLCCVQIVVLFPSATSLSLANGH